MSKKQNRLVTLDKIKLQQKLNTNFACSYSDDQRLAVLSENGVYVLQLGCDSENRLQSFSFKKSFYTIPQYQQNLNNTAYSISENVAVDINEFIDLLNQHDVHESILNVNISQQLEGASSLHVVPVSVQWSPKGVDKGRFSLFSVLTNTGVLEVIGREIGPCDINEYYPICNITDCAVNLFKRDFRNVERRSPEEQLAELKLRVDKVNITAFTWGGLRKDNSCYLFCGHADGGISLWNISSGPNVAYREYFNSSLKHITAMCWLHGGNTGLLISGDLHGRISVIIVKTIDNSVCFDEIVIYSDCDNIKVECIKYFIYNELTHIIIAKGTFIICAIFNEKFDLLDQKLFSCENLAITGVEHYEDNILLIATYTGVIKQLQFFHENNELRIESTDVPNDVNWKKYRAHGLFVSHNRVFVGILIHPVHTKYFAKTNQFLTMVILRNYLKSPMQLLLDNKTGSLECYWDCLEVLRTFGLKRKKYPCEKYPFILKLNYDTLSLLEIKTLLHISKITRVIYSRKVKDINRNIESVTVLNVIMQMKLAIKRLKDLVQAHSEGKTLSQLQLNSMELADIYLREIILGKILQKFELTTHTVDEIYDAMAYIRNIQFPPLPKCIWCKNTISCLTCFPPHTDTRCAISFVQITDPVCYKCSFCKSTVHKSIVEEEHILTCPFCDLPLQQTFFNDKLQGRSFSEEIEELCAEDCLKERLDADFVEEEAFVKIDNFGYLPKACPNFDELSISDASTADDSDIDYIFEKELMDNDSKECFVQSRKQMEVD